MKYIMICNMNVRMIQNHIKHLQSFPIYKTLESE